MSPAARSALDLLLPDEVHVFSCALPLDASLALPDPRLDADENQRAARFVFPVDRARFITSHLALRAVFARCLGDAAAAVVVAAAGAKPRLAQHPDVSFNLSQSGAVALVAIARGREVGVDVEQHAAIDKTPLYPSLSPAERAAVDPLTGAARQQALRRLWARKEAFLKACGLGLRGGLADFDVSIGDDARLEGTRPDAHEAARWQMQALPAPHGYEAALVYARPAARVLMHDLQVSFGSGEGVGSI